MCDGAGSCDCNCDCGQCDCNCGNDCGTCCGELCVGCEKCCGESCGTLGDCCVQFGKMLWGGCEFLGSCLGAVAKNTIFCCWIDSSINNCCQGCGDCCSCQAPSTPSEPLAQRWDRLSTGQKGWFGVLIFGAILASVALIVSGFGAIAGIELAAVLALKVGLVSGSGLISALGLALGLSSFYTVGVGFVGLEKHPWTRLFCQLAILVTGIALTATGIGAFFGMPLILMIAPKILIGLTLFFGIPALLTTIASARETFARSWPCCCNDSESFEPVHDDSLRLGPHHSYKGTGQGASYQQDGGYSPQVDFGQQGQAEQRWTCCGGMFDQRGGSKFTGQGPADMDMGDSHGHVKSAVSHQKAA